MGGGLASLTGLVVLVSVAVGGRAEAQDVAGPGTATVEVTDGPELVTTTDEVVTTTDEVTVTPDEVTVTTDTDPGDPCAIITCVDPDPSDCITFTCTNGACEAVPVAKDVAVGTARACLPADPCAAGGVCANDGTCMPTAFVDCGDGDACTFDSCVDGTCEHVLTLCDDGIACTTDICIDGQCSFTATPACGGGCVPVDCDDGDPCSADYCADAFCHHVPVSCEDGDACTADACTPSGCMNVPMQCAGSNPCVDQVCDQGLCRDVFAAGACDDGDACTDDGCDLIGGCWHAPHACDDQNACTSDACVGGACVAFPVDAACDDGDGCTRDDQCLAGLCMPGAAKICDDGTACTADACDPATGQCTYPRAAGACELCAAPGDTERFDTRLDLAVALGVDCPLVGGRAGVVLGAHGALGAEREGCPACRAAVSGDVALSAEVTLCQGAAFSVTANGKFAASRNYGTTCDTDSCLLACSDAFCESERFTGFAGLGVSRFLGFQRRWRAGGATSTWGERGALEVGVRCGVAVDGEVRAEGRTEATADGGAGGTCADCAANEGALTVGAEGTGGCAVDLRAGHWTTTVGCPGCAWLGVEAEATAREHEGACAGVATSTPTATSDATVTAPCLTVGLGWYAVAATCEAALAGSCGASGCSTDAAVARCTVLGGVCE